MATLQRSKAFRRQGSSGSVWDGTSESDEEKNEHRELRPSQSGSNIMSMDCSNSIPLHRSLSTPNSANYDHHSNETSANLSKPLGIPKSKSRKRDVILNLLTGNV
ncbi:hypothetical protein M5689_011824 [Euphorbia peplus]|nr:hypothetical protein M5689_011824 [Euphorbia peplus]